MLTYQFTIWALLGLAVQTVLPVLIDLVTTTVTRNGVKTVLLGLLTIAVTLATGLLNAHDSGTPFDVVQALIEAVGGFIVSIASYYKVWRGTRLQAAAQNALVTAPVPPSDPAPLASVTDINTAAAAARAVVAQTSRYGS